MWYLSYQNGEDSNGEEYGKFTAKRGYFRFTKEIMPWFDSHITLIIKTP
ncbi:MAG: hypothetical protein AB1610_07710 [Nitrospirota bacterium]